MVKVKPTITLELASGQQITIDLQEAKDVIKNLSRFVSNTNSDVSRQSTMKQSKTATRKTSRRGTKVGSSILAASMSETKRQEIIDHVNKQLSARPKTLSALLKGVSYVPNYLPAIREMIENRGNIAKEVIGKRKYYSRKSSPSQTSQKQSRTSAIGN